LSIPAAIIGASGYAGGELVRLLDAHDAFDVVFLGAHSKAGSALREVHPNLGGGDRVLQPHDEIPNVEIAFLALPHGASWEMGEELARRGTKVVDLGSDYRMDTPARYEAAYGSAHPLPDRLDDWIYGLPELPGIDVAGAALVASPGCYPTSALLGLAPLVAAGAIEPSAIVVDSMSGVTGAGRGLKENLLYGAVDESVAAYGVATHRHRPEIEMGLLIGAGIDTRVQFTPHLVPMQRGILSTCSAPTLSDPVPVLEAAYADHPFVEVVDAPPQTRWVVGSNRALIHAKVDPGTDRSIVLVVIDNLLKGAAGQAVQAANLMVGVPEETGLPTTGWLP
jgi:N-acetyl-gamma-glutamyl-phosphate reductase